MRGLFLALLLLTPAVADAGAPRAAAVGSWVFVARATLPDGQPLAVRGKFLLHPDGTMVMTDDGGYSRGLSPQTLASLAAKGVRIAQGPALGVWSLEHGVFRFRVTRFLTNGADLLGGALGVQTIEGTGVFVARGTRWEFVGGWPVKWVGPEFDASKNELAIESIEIAHEGLEIGG